MRFLLFGGFYFGKILKILEKRPFFRADTAGLGKYCTGGYGRIGVYRVNGHSDIGMVLKIQVMTMSHCVYLFLHTPILSNVYKIIVLVDIILPVPSNVQ